MRSGAIPILVALAGLAISPPAGIASSVELRDAELLAGGSPVLQNGAGTVRLEDARLGRVSPPALMPEPGALWQLGPGIALLALLARRHRRTASSDPGPADPVTPRRRMP